MRRTLPIIGQLDELKKDVRDVITHPNYSEPFLNAGRLVHIQHNDFDFGWGIILKYTKSIGEYNATYLHLVSRFVFFFLLQLHIC